MNPFPRDGIINTVSLIGPAESPGLRGGENNRWLFMISSVTNVNISLRNMYPGSCRRMTRSALSAAATRSPRSSPVSSAAAPQAAAAVVAPPLLPAASAEPDHAASLAVRINGNVLKCSLRVSMWKNVQGMRNAMHGRYAPPRRLCNLTRVRRPWF